MSGEPNQQRGGPSVSLDVDTTYRNVIDAQFVSRALADGARCVRGARWVTEALYPRDGPDVITTAYYEYNRTFEALAMVEGALAHVIRSAETVTLRQPDRSVANEVPERTAGSHANDAGLGSL